MELELDISSIVINGSGAATVTILKGGFGYVVNETFTVAAAQIGGAGAALTFDVATVGPSIEGLQSNFAFGFKTGRSNLLQQYSVCYC